MSDISSIKKMDSENRKLVIKYNKEHNKINFNEYSMVVHGSVSYGLEPGNNYFRVTLDTATVLELQELDEYITGLLIEGGMLQEDISPPISMSYCGMNDIDTMLITMSKKSRYLVGTKTTTSKPTKGEKGKFQILFVDMNIGFPRPKFELHIGKVEVSTITKIKYENVEDLI